MDSRFKFEIIKESRARWKRRQTMTIKKCRYRRRRKFENNSEYDGRCSDRSEKDYESELMKWVLGEHLATLQGMPKVETSEELEGRVAPESR